MTSYICYIQYVYIQTNIFFLDSWTREKFQTKEILSKTSEKPRKDELISQSWSEGEIFASQEFDDDVRGPEEQETYMNEEALLDMVKIIAWKVKFHIVKYSYLNILK